MSNNNGDSTMCRIVCIVIGLLAGALAWYLLRDSAGPVATAVISFFTFFATAWFLHEGFCGKEDSTAAKGAAGVAAAGAAAVTAKKMGRSDRDAWTGSEAASAASSSDAANFVASETEDAKPATKKPAAKKPAGKKAAPKKAAAKTKTAAASKPAASKKAPAKKAPAKKAGPERLKKPKGKADDLKRISGVGPKLEKTLNDLGFWHFEQIAKWKKADVAIVDDELSFKGRIERDDWIKQAKALAKSG